MLSFNSPGSFKKTTNFLDRLLNKQIYEDLSRYGQMGVNALALATPKETGTTAQSWGYNITRDRNGWGIEWYNHNTNPVMVAVILQYGHATGTGGYVPALDYINPALRPIFDEIADDIWKKVTT